MQTAPAKGQSVFDTGIVTRAANTTTARNETPWQHVNAGMRKTNEKINANGKGAGHEYERMDIMPPYAEKDKIKNPGRNSSGKFSAVLYEVQTGNYSQH